VFFGSVITWNFSCQNTRYSSRFSLNQSWNYIAATKGSNTWINIKLHQVQVCLNLHLMRVFMLHFELSGINWHNLETPWAISPKTQQQPPTAMCTAGVLCTNVCLDVYFIESRCDFLVLLRRLLQTKGLQNSVLPLCHQTSLGGKYVWNLASISSHKDNFTCKGHGNEEMIV
jgi:hypothetical protein